MNRGSQARPVGAGSPPECFNEAPIHESGKSRDLYALEDLVEALQ